MMVCVLMGGWELKSARAWIWISQVISWLVGGVRERGRGRGLVAVGGSFDPSDTFTCGEDMIKRSVRQNVVSVELEL